MNLKLANRIRVSVRQAQHSLKQPEFQGQGDPGKWVRIHFIRQLHHGAQALAMLREGQDPAYEVGRLSENIGMAIAAIAYLRKHNTTEKQP